MDNMMITYNRLAAVEYAKKWAFKRNPKYFDFTQLGGNCTNYVSQCLVAGGMPMNYNYPLGWFFRSVNDRAAAFTGVQYFYNFLTRNAKSRGPNAIEIDLKNAQLGDIIQLSFDGESFSHATIIVKTNGSNPLLAANTYDVLYKPLSDYFFQNIRVLHILGAYP